MGVEVIKIMNILKFIDPYTHPWKVTFTMWEFKILKILKEYKFINIATKEDISLWLIHVEVWQKTTKFCKAIILQLKNKFQKLIN